MEVSTPYIHTIFHANTLIESGDFDQLGVVVEAWTAIMPCSLRK